MDFAAQLATRPLSPLKLETKRFISILYCLLLLNANKVLERICWQGKGLQDPAPPPHKAFMHFHGNYAIITFKPLRVKGFGGIVTKITMPFSVIFNCSRVTCSRFKNMPLQNWVKRQNVCFSRRVDLSDKMCAFSGVGMGGLWGVVLGL